MDSNPTIDQIINDEVAFYAHTILRFGIQFNAWYKIGKSTEIGEKELKKVYFCQTQDHEAVFNPFPELIWVDPLKNWYLWHVNEEHQRIGKLPKKYWTIVEPGGVIPYIDIINRMRYGFYKYASVMYDVIKRIPLPDVDVYLKTEEDGISIQRISRCETADCHRRERDQADCRQSQSRRTEAANRRFRRHQLAQSGFHRKRRIRPRME
jgi:hypothetical protein